MTTMGKKIEEAHFAIADFSSIFSITFHFKTNAYLHLVEGEGKDEATLIPPTMARGTMNARCAAQSTENKTARERKKNKQTTIKKAGTIYTDFSPKYHPPPRRQHDCCERQKNVRGRKSEQAKQTVFYSFFVVFSSDSLLFHFHLRAFPSFLFHFGLFFLFCLFHRSIRPSNQNSVSTQTVCVCAFFFHGFMAGAGMRSETT